MPTIEEFAQTIKQKYPQYKDIDDRELGNKMIEKYPQYKTKVFDTDPTSQSQLAPKTEGVVDAVKKGVGNIKESFRKVSKEEIPDILTNKDTSQFAKTVGVTGKLLKPFATAGAEAVMTPLRAGGEVVESVTGKDVNSAIGEKVGQAVNAGLDTETGQKIISAFDILESQSPEAATVLGGLIDFVDFATMAGGGGSVAKQGAKGTLKAGEKVLSTTGKGISKTGGGIAKTAKFTTGQTFGLNPETVSSVIKNPELFTTKEIAKIDRESIFGKVKNAVDKRLEELSETGKGYESIKNTSVKTSVSDDSIKNVLKEKGIEVNDGKVISTLDSDIPLTKADTKALEEVIGDVSGLKNLSPKQVLNLRKKLDVASKWGEGKSDASKKVVREIRKHIDEVAKKEIPGLADLDKKFSGEIKLMNNIKKSIFNKDGSLKDNAISKIATLTGKGKEQALKRMKKVIPTIEEDLNILKAIEDIQYTSGQKVGTYARTAAGAGGGAVLGGPVGAVVGMILTSPQVGLSLLRNYGKASNISKKLLDKTINKMKAGKKLLGEEKKIMDGAVDDAAKKLGNRAKNIQPGLSTKAVKIHPDDSKALTDFIDEVRLKKTIPGSRADDADYIFEKLGINIDQDANKLAKIAEDILAGNKDASALLKTGREFKDFNKAGTAKSALAKEAKKYKSADEFVKAQRTRKIEVRDKSGLKLQDPYTAEYLPTNSDGTITLYHSTTKEGAEKIKQSGIFGSKAESGDIYFTTNKKGYGGIGKDKNVVVAFNIDPKKVKFDDVYRGELHLKGNNADIGGIKPVTIKTKSQLTDIWNKANKK